MENRMSRVEVDLKLLELKVSLFALNILAKQMNILFRTDD